MIDQRIVGAIEEGDPAMFGSQRDETGHLGIRLELSSVSPGVGSP
jgi:hypothetical protein